MIHLAPSVVPNKEGLNILSLKPLRLAIVWRSYKNPVESEQIILSTSEQTDRKKGE